MGGRPGFAFVHAWQMTLPRVLDSRFSSAARGFLGVSTLRAMTLVILTQDHRPGNTRRKKKLVIHRQTRRHVQDYPRLPGIYGNSPAAKSDSLFKILTVSISTVQRSTTGRNTSANQFTFICLTHELFIFFCTKLYLFITVRTLARDFWTLHLPRKKSPRWKINTSINTRGKKKKKKKISVIKLYALEN